MKARPKILVTATTFPRCPEDTSPRFVFDLCTSLADLGTLQPLVLAPHVRGSKTYEVIEGIEVYRYRYFIEKLEMISGNGIMSRISTHKLLYLLVPFLVFFQFTSVLRLVRKYNIEILLSHWIVPQALTSVLVKPFFPRLRLVTISHGGDAALLNRNRSLKLLGRFILRRMDTVVAVSSFIKRQLEDTGFDTAPIHVIPMGVDLPLFQEAGGTARDAKEFDLLFVGRLEKKKGLSYLIDAVRLLKQDHSMSVKVAIIGDGSERSSLQKRTRDLDLDEQISFKGALTHKELIQYLAKSRILVAPSINLNDDVEGMPTVIIEALSVGLPVVTTDAGGITDVIHDGENGIIVKQQSASELANAIRSLLWDTATQDRLRRNALDTAKNYSYKSIARQYETLLLRLMHE